MKRRHMILFLLVAFLLAASLALAADRKPVEVKKNDKCQVCGMFVSKYKEWIAQIIFTNGEYAVFDGPKDMFKYYFNLAKYNPSKKQSDIEAIYVTEYYSTKLMDGRKMFYVLGSDVFGPMGAELVPLESMQTAGEFRKDHNGRKILKFNEVTREVLD